MIVDLLPMRILETGETLNNIFDFYRIVAYLVFIIWNFAHIYTFDAFLFCGKLVRILSLLSTLR